MFMNLAHRGASAYAPENTLAAFYRAIELGANGIETDLRRTRDGVILLLHDRELNRTTNGRGTPAKYTWSELESLDAGSWFGQEFMGERIVTLELFLYLFGRRNLLFALELKDANLEVATLELIERYGVGSKVTLTSFQYEHLVAVRKEDPSIKLGHLVSRIDEPNIDALLEIGGNQICPAAKWLQPEDVALAKEHGLEVRAWGIADEAMMHHALRCGVDGMTINFPDLLAEALSE